MIDKDFEMQAAEALTIPRNYFNRYAVLYASLHSSRLAWEALEDELQAQTGGRRFNTLDSFKNEMSKFHSGQGSTEVRLKFESKR